MPSAMASEGVVKSFQSILITGASSGIGTALAEEFAAKGVMGDERNRDRHEQFDHRERAPAHPANQGEMFPGRHGTAGK